MIILKLLKNNLLAIVFHGILCFIFYHIGNWLYSKDLCLEHCDGQNFWQLIICVFVVIIQLFVVVGSYILIGRYLLRPVRKNRQKYLSVIGLFVCLLVAWICSFQTVGLAWSVMGTLPFYHIYKPITGIFKHFKVVDSYFWELGILFVFSAVPCLIMALSIRKKAHDSR